MQKRFQLRFKRQLRKSQRQVEGLSNQAEVNIDKLLFKRFARLTAVRRFVIGWLLLFTLLIGGLFIQILLLGNYFQTLKTVPGGIYKQGVLGQFTNVNPLFANSSADLTVSHLLFSGLLKNDPNGQLTGDLAKSYSVDAKGLVYTVNLKPNLTWHDGQKLTSADVLFTYKTIQNPDAHSPLQSSWRDIAITAPNPQTVVFTLPGPLASFAYNLTNGIIPQHALATVPVADLRSNDFNTVKPIGSGPFMWQAIQVSGTDKRNAQEQIALVPFAKYSAGKPKLDEFIVQIYASADELQNAFASNQLTAAVGLNEVPKNLKRDTNVQKHNVLLKAETMVFFKTSSGVLADKAVRQALVQSADVPKITDKLGYPTHLVREPLLNGQLGYDKAYGQPKFNLSAAKKALDADGWVVGSDGIRHKDKKPLMFSLSAADNPEYRAVTSQLKQQWQELGVKLQVQLQQPNDFRSTVTYHTYDALLNGISVGVDPDVFVYWDGSQADIRSSNRLNFSEYKNPAADSALEAGRTRLKPEVRAFKYRAFLQAWQQDAPALGLYQPRLLYLTHGAVGGLDDTSVTSTTDIFNNVQNWEIRQARVTN